LSPDQRFKKTNSQDIPCGNAVIVEEGGGTVVCLKAEREGKEYVHHYLIPLDPRRGPDLQLIYVDPEDEVVDCGCRVEIDPGEAVGGSDKPAPEVGDALRNADGLFLKAIEDPKSQKMFAFIDIGAGPTLGQVRRRQERALTAVYPGWRATAADGDEVLTLESLRQAYTEP
jgi:hypothetical protein